MSQALTAAELILAREQRLSALDGLAAAAAHQLGTPLSTIALVAKELEREVPRESPWSEDITLLRTQAARCRDILSELSKSGPRPRGRLFCANPPEPPYRGGGGPAADAWRGHQSQAHGCGALVQAVGRAGYPAKSRADPRSRQSCRKCRRFRKKRGDHRCKLRSGQGAPSHRR